MSSSRSETGLPTNGLPVAPKKPTRRGSLPGLRPGTIKPGQLRHGLSLSGTNEDSFEQASANQTASDEAGQGKQTRRDRESIRLPKGLNFQQPGAKKPNTTDTVTLSIKEEPPEQPAGGNAGTGIKSKKEEKPAGWNADGFFDIGQDDPEKDLADQISALEGDIKLTKQGIETIIKAGEVESWMTSRKEELIKELNQQKTNLLTLEIQLLDRQMRQEGLSVEEQRKLNAEKVTKAYEINQVEQTVAEWVQKLEADTKDAETARQVAETARRVAEAAIKETDTREIRNLEQLRKSQDNNVTAKTIHEETKEDVEKRLTGAVDILKNPEMPNFLKKPAQKELNDIVSRALQVQRHLQLTKSQPQDPYTKFMLEIASEYNLQKTEMKPTSLGQSGCRTSWASYLNMKVQTKGLF